MDKLLEILSENSSFTTKELAMMLGEPENYISAKIKEYEQSGVIKGYHAIIDWAKVEDAGVTALIELKVTPQKETGFDCNNARLVVEAAIQAEKGEMTDERELDGAVVSFFRAKSTWYFFATWVNALIFLSLISMFASPAFCWARCFRDCFPR